MWEVRTQFSKPNAEASSSVLEWSAVQVDTQEAAEGWWDCRTRGRAVARCVHTMTDPQGTVVRVCFK
jgi:purine nucleoside permease